jgi:FkbH-like protein
MSDRFGDYGTIGLALVHRDPAAWHLKLMLMSCRTISRGVGTILLSHIMHTAAGATTRLRADFVETGRNRMMQITYAFAGFREVGRDGDHVTLENDLAQIQAFPDYVDVVT